MTRSMSVYFILINALARTSSATYLVLLGLILVANGGEVILGARELFKRMRAG